MKKIMAVLLTVAVLFAFAACDNSTVNPYFGKQVASVTLESTPDYLGGETINPADVELRVVYDDGTTAFITGDEAGLDRLSAPPHQRGRESRSRAVKNENQAITAARNGL